MKKHKLFFFSDDTMIYIKNPKKSTKYPTTSKQVQQNHRTKLKVQKTPPVFLYTSNEHVKNQNRNLYAGQEATVRSGHGTTDWFQIGKGVRQGCILSPCLFNLYAEYVMRNAGLEETQAGIKTARRNIKITSDMQMIPPLWQKVKRNSKASR